jgi:hypothetical protein
MGKKREREREKEKLFRAYLGLRLRNRAFEKKKKNFIFKLLSKVRFDNF